MRRHMLWSDLPKMKYKLWLRGLALPLRRLPMAILKDPLPVHCLALLSGCSFEILVFPGWLSFSPQFG
jgi:hypothetical protein